MISVAYSIAKRAALVGVIIGVILLLPDAPESLDTLTIPTFIWTPLVAVLELDRYFPISTLLAIAAVAITIKVGMFGLWLTSWVAKHVFGT